MKLLFIKAKYWLRGLSFRTGVAMLILCVICYILSFAQAALPIPLPWKGALWVTFFGLAKTFQYTGLFILGKEGWLRVKAWVNRLRNV